MSRAEIDDVYVRIPHSLKVTVPADVTNRLEKFYRQTFWSNVEAFQCCQAAQALAKRGLNIVRIFIGLSSGGVGQSLYSSHLQAVLAKSCCYCKVILRKINPKPLCCNPCGGHVWQQFCVLRSKYMVERRRNEEASGAAKRLFCSDRTPVMSCEIWGATLPPFKLKFYAFQPCHFFSSVECLEDKKHRAQTGD